MMSNDISVMPTSPQALMDQLDAWGMAYDLYEHEAVFTVAESEKVDAKIPAHHTRNMFLRTKKKENYLVTLSHDTPIDLKKLENLLEAKRFSFGSPDRLMEILGVYPGSVTPLSVVNTQVGDLKIVLEKKMMEAKTIAIHPLVNTMTVTLTPESLLTFIKKLGHTPYVIDLAPAMP